MLINTLVNSNHHPEKLKLRESLTAEIVSEVEQEIDDVLNCAGRIRAGHWRRPGAASRCEWHKSRRIDLLLRPSPNLEIVEYGTGFHSNFTVGFRFLAFWF